MYCTTCGRQLEDGARFCSRCGKGLQIPQKNLPGAENAYNVRHAYKPMPVQMQGVGISRRKKKSGPVLAGIAVLLLVVSAAVLVVPYIQSGLNGVFEGTSSSGISQNDEKDNTADTTTVDAAEIEDGVIKIEKRF